MQGTRSRSNHAGADAGGIGGRPLPLAVVAETGRLDDERSVERADGDKVGGIDQRGTRGDRDARPFEERLLRDAVLGDRHGPGRRGDDDVAGEALQGGRWGVLELGGDHRATRRQLVERRSIVVGGDEMTVGDGPGRCIGVRVEDDRAIAGQASGDDGKAPELATAQHPDGRRRGDRRSSVVHVGGASRTESVACCRRSDR